MSKFDDFNVWNNTAFSVAQDILSTYHSSKLFESINAIQSTIASLQSPAIAAISKMQNRMEGFEAAIKMTSAFYDYIQNMQGFQAMIPGSLIEAIRVRESIASALGNIDLSFVNQFSEIVSGFSINDNLPWIETIRSFEDIDLSDNPEAEAEVAQEIKTFIANPSEILNSTSGWTVVKKYALKILVGILLLLLTPAIDETKATILEALGINQMWEDSGYYEFIHGVFGIEDSIAVSEEEAKATVDKSQTGNISKQNREDLLGKIKEIRTYIASAPQDENTGNLLKYLSEIEKDVNGQKYGLVFEEHREDIDVVLDTHTPVLTEQEELFIDNGGQMNFLIEGDNLASLKLLEKTHKGKIDVIYIDPPYNTGGTDFRYDDAVIGKDDTFRHSKWISFIKKRLSIAKKLLSENGIIFVSIDENEQAALKLLCDEVFSRENHVETIIWKNKYGAGAKTVGFISVHEYVLCYSKNPIKDLSSELDKEGQSVYKKKDDKFETRGGYLTQPLMTTSLGDRPNLMYDIEYNGDIITPRKQWVWSKERLLAAIENNEVEFNKQKDGTYSVRAKKYLIDENGNMRRGKPLSILNGPFTQDGTKEIRYLLGSEDAFKFAKPSELIRYFVSFCVNDRINKDAVILDFFAGSGTTAQAVLEQNKRDNGNRSFILCTNNENDICRDVTYERIKRVIDKENYEASLKYYKVEYVPIDEQLYYEYADELLCHIRELVELENGVNFTENAEIGIVLTDEELFDFFENIDEYSKCKKLYIGHDLLLDEEQEAIVAKNSIQIIIIPDYYYRDLQEG